jgi:FkbM family methyltransferase
MTASASSVEVVSAGRPAWSKGVTSALRAYYAGPDHPAKLRLWRWFRRLSGYPRLTVDLAGGGTITLDERDYMERELLLHGDYEPEVWAALASHVSAGDVVWDVGANIGDVTIKAMQHPSIREVHAFEPHPVVATLLRRHAAMNRGRAIVHEVALGRTNGSATLHNAVFPLSGGHTLEIDTRNSAFAGAFDVSCRTVDSLVYEEGVPAPSLLKVDIEQLELPFFQGASRLLREAPPRAIVFEASRDVATGAFEEPALPALLQRAGYDIEWLRRADGHCYLRENFLARHHDRPSA